MSLPLNGPLGQAWLKRIGHLRDGPRPRRELIGFLDVSCLFSVHSLPPLLPRVPLLYILFLLRTKVMGPAKQSLKP